MANEHIGRLQAIGFGPESNPGTDVAATFWLPKKSGVLKPVFEKAKDDSAYGVIDEVYDSQTVKQTTEVPVGGIVRDNFIGNFLRAAMGLYTPVFIATLASITGGSPARGDVVYSASSSWTGVLRKILTVGSTTYYCFETTNAGTLTSGATDLTNGTWTATVTTDTYAAIKGHLFRRLNNNHHPTFTAYGYDPVGSYKAAYCILDKLEISANVGEYIMYSGTFKGKKMASTSPQSPFYTEDNPFLAKHATVTFADEEDDLNGATPSELQNFSLTFNKNPQDVPKLGTEDVASIHNTVFGIAGNLEAIYQNTTLLDYVANSTKKACRMAVINNNVPALYSNGANSVYPSMYIDLARVSFDEWDRNDDNNALASQTLGYSSEFAVNKGMSIEILLLNSNATGYDPA